MGRKLKITPELIENICQHVESGMTYEQSCIMAGIGTTTFYRWKRFGQAATKGKYREFWQSLKRADSKARVVCLTAIHNAVKGGHVIEEIREVQDKDGNIVERIITKKKTLPVWQAAAWILERRFSTEFGKHVQPQPADEHDPLDDWVNQLNEAEKMFGAE